APLASVELRLSRDGAALASFTADLRGGFEVRLPAGHPLEAGIDAPGSAWLVARDAEAGEQRIELPAAGHGGHGLGVARASRDGRVTLCREPRGGLPLHGFRFREPLWHGPVCHASIAPGAPSDA